MDPYLFVSKIQECEPTVEEMIKFGLSKEEASSALTERVAKKREKKLELGDNDILFELFSLFEMGSIRVGMIEFLSKPLEREETYIIAKVDIDWIILDTKEKKIYLENGEDGSKIFSCAINSDSFLSALSVAACFLSRCSLNTELARNQEEKLKIVDECAELAGGKEYWDFYAYLVGID